MSDTGFGLAPIKKEGCNISFGNDTEFILRELELTNKDEIIGKIIMGLECDNADDAWTTFRIALKQELKWCKGYKYWRRQPELLSNCGFADSKEIYIVRARIIASMKPIRGLKRALNNP